MRLPAGGLSCDPWRVEAMAELAPVLEDARIERAVVGGHRVGVASRVLPLDGRPDGDPQDLGGEEVVEVAHDRVTAGAPFPANPGEITRYEEERTVAYFGTGYLYANEGRLEPLM